MDTKTKPMTGGCLCGDVRYDCQHQLHDVVVCHCKDCQKVTGSSATYNARIPIDALKITQDEVRSYSIAADSGDQLTRFFCGRCGSQLLSQREALADMITLKVGTLDDPSALRLARHIWTQSAMPWVELDDTLPRHAGEFESARAVKPES